MIAGIRIEQARVIVEYGPGTGAFTSMILRHKPPAAMFLAIEKSPFMAAAFRTRFPDIPLFEDRAENVSTILGTLGAASADCIISGIPWAFMSFADQEALLEATHGALSHTGVFTTFAYVHGALTPRGVNFRKRLRNYFPRVDTSRVAWLNLPPAFVYRCYKNGA